MQRGKKCQQKYNFTGQCKDISYLEDNRYSYKCC